MNRPTYLHYYKKSSVLSVHKWVVKGAAHLVIIFLPVIIILSPFTIIYIVIPFLSFIFFLWDTKADVFVRMGMLIFSTVKVNRDWDSIMEKNRLVDWISIIPVIEPHELQLIKLYQYLLRESPRRRWFKHIIVEDK